MMYGRGKSSPVIVAGKPASVTAAESVERRAGAKGNANQPARAGRPGVRHRGIVGTTVVGLEMKPVGEPYAGNPHVRFVATSGSRPQHRIIWRLLARSAREGLPYNRYAVIDLGVGLAEARLWIISSVRTVRRKAPWRRCLVRSCRSGGARRRGWR